MINGLWISTSPVSPTPSRSPFAISPYVPIITMTDTAAPPSYEETWKESLNGLQHQVDIYETAQRVVMYRARLGSKARAWASKRREPSLGRRLRLGSGLGRGLKRESKKRDNGYHRKVLQGRFDDKLLTVQFQC